VARFFLECVQRLSGQREEGFAESLVLGRVRVEERSDVFGIGLPVHCELGLSDEFADARADHVHTDDGPVVDAHDLHRTGGADDVALAVAGEVVVVGRDLVCPELVGGLGLRIADRRDLGVAVRDLRDVQVVDDDRVQARDFFGDEDSLLESAVRELEAGNDVADRVQAGNARR
jgi:hypothetical protein